MKILLLTDIHSDYDAAKAANYTEEPDFVLDSGDHEDIKNLFEFTPHAYIHGNHEPEVISCDSDSAILPFKINPGQILSLKKDDDEVRVSGIDGNYSSLDSVYSVNDYFLSGLRQIPDNGVDIILTHESPLNVSNGFSDLSKKVLNEIDRINPKFVFSGHRGSYGQEETPGGVLNITLDDMAHGYGVLEVKNGEYSFDRKRRFFRGARK